MGLFSHAVGGHRPHWAKVKVSEGCLLQEGPGENLLLASFWGPPGPLGSWPLPPSLHPLLFDRISPPLLLIVPPPYHGPCDQHQAHPDARVMSQSQGQLMSNSFSDSSEGKEPTYNGGDLGSTPGLGRSPGERHGNPLQYSCLEKPRDRGAWWTTVPRVAKSQTQLSNYHVNFHV